MIQLTNPRRSVEAGNLGWNYADKISPTQVQGHASREEQRQEGILHAYS